MCERSSGSGWVSKAWERRAPAEGQGTWGQLPVYGDPENSFFEGWVECWQLELVEGSLYTEV